MKDKGRGKNRKQKSIIEDLWLKLSNRKKKLYKNKQNQFRLTEACWSSDSENSGSLMGTCGWTEGERTFILPFSFISLDEDNEK